jgi:hypothetical protein
VPKRGIVRKDESSGTGCDTITNKTPRRNASCKVPKVFEEETKENRRRRKERSTRGCGTVESRGTLERRDD